jgi:hypothetical protein
MQDKAYKYPIPPSRALALYDVKEPKFFSHIKKSLNPAIPVIPIGIFRCFRAVAYVHIGASPNEDINISLASILLSKCAVKPKYICYIPHVFVPGDSDAGTPPYNAKIISRGAAVAANRWSKTYIISSPNGFTTYTLTWLNAAANSSISDFNTLYVWFKLTTSDSYSAVCGNSCTKESSADHQVSRAFSLKSSNGNVRLNTMVVVKGLVRHSNNKQKASRDD